MSEKSKVSLVEKVDIVLRSLKGEWNIQEAGGRIGVDQATIRRWTSRYESEGAEAFMRQERNRVYDAELKRNAVQDYLSEAGSLVEISKKYRLRHPRQLSNWIKVYHAHGDLNSVKQSEGGSYMKQGRETTQEERIQIAKVYCIRQELRRDGTEISGQLPAGMHMDAAL